MSFLTCFWLLPQNEHLSRSPPSPMRATARPHPLSSVCWRPLGGSVMLPVRRLATTLPPTAPDVDQVGPIRRRGRLLRQVVGLAARQPDCGRRLALVGQLATVDDLVDEAVLDTLGGGKNLVSLDVALDLFLRLPRMRGKQLLELAAHPKNLPSLDLDVAGLTAT